jgi:5-oxoprolinase (ATP-hydrolysing)
LEGKGARAGLVVTAGHKDVLAIRRSQIPGGLGAWINYVQPEPIVPLERTVEAVERIQITGEVFKPLDEQVFRDSLVDLKRQKPEAIAVSLLNSFSNNEHENTIRRILQEEFGPEVEIVTSSEVLPEIQEYERTVTTTANAIVKPIVKRYMKNLKNSLSKDTEKLRILKSDGDLTSIDLAAEFPVNILMSGPAGGVKAVSHLVARNTPFKNLITVYQTIFMSHPNKLTTYQLDMGGTSTDCALLSGSEVLLRRETNVGSLTVKAPSVDVSRSQ